MKQKILFALLAVVCLVGCGSDDEDFEKFYADDDFVMTDKNIQEKIIGTWIIDAQMTNGEWTDVKDRYPVSAYTRISISHDGTCQFNDYNDVKYSVQDRVLSFTVLALVVEETDGVSTHFFPLHSQSELPEMKKLATEYESRGCVTRFEQTELVSFTVEKMSKNELILKSLYRYRLTRH